MLIKPHKMRILSIALVLIIFTANRSLAQKEYKVLFVKESSVFIKNQAIKVGDIFSENDELNFSNDADILKVCYNECTKTKILAGKNFSSSNSLTLKDYLINTKGLATRGEQVSVCISFDDLKKMNKIGVLGQLKICVDTSIFVNGNNNYFKIYYTGVDNNGSYNIYKWHDQIILDSVIMNSICKSLNSDKFKMNLQFHSTSDDQDFDIINNLEINYINIDIITNELKTFLQSPDISSKEKQEIILDYLAIFYPSAKILQIPDL